MGGCPWGLHGCLGSGPRLTCSLSTTSCGSPGSWDTLQRPSCLGGGRGLPGLQGTQGPSPSIPILHPHGQSAQQGPDRWGPQALPKTFLSVRGLSFILGSSTENTRWYRRL